MSDVIKWETLVTKDDKLVEHRASVFEALNVERDRRIASGIEFQGNTYQTRPEDIQNLMGAIQIGQLAASQGLPFSINWLTEDNVTVTLDLETLANLGIAVATHKETLVYKCRAHKNAINALTSISDINDYMGTLTW